jgi:two-component system, cell cycle sensor histidine kinase and response regulator CckA
LCGIALQLFVALHIYQMHGIAEMHLFFFTAFTMMIVYCDWSAMWPGAFLILAQHFVFAILHNQGVNLYFFEKKHVPFTELWFYFAIAIGHVAICGWWAQLLRKQQLMDFAQQLKIEQNREQIEEQLEITRKSEAALQAATRDLMSTKRLLEIDIEARQLAQQTLREKEAILRSVLTNLADAVIVADRQNRYLVYNPASERMFGKPTPDSTATDWAQDYVFSLAGASTVIAAEYLPLARTIRGEEVDDLELLVQMPTTAQNFWISVNGRPLRDHRGEVNGGVIVCRDITERKRAERAILESEKQLRQAHKMEAVGRLAGGVAHDFNNLLTVISGYSNLLLYDPDCNEQQREQAEQIAQAAERAAALTGQLLTFSRKQVVHNQPVQMNKTIEGIGNMLRRLAGEDIEIVYRLSSDLGNVIADPGQIEQVIMNLAINARDAMMPKGGKVFIETRNVQVDVSRLAHNPEVQPGRYVLMTASDTGCGMSPETQAQIFEPFFTTKEKGKGTGLGLSIVYGIVQQCGGYITVHSRLGHGSTFAVYLPLANAEAQVEQTERVMEPSMAGSETVLLVEDEAAVRMLIRNVLDKNGYKVLEATCGAEALSICESYTGFVDLILTDVVMPGLKGPELVSRLQRRIPKARVLYISGYTDTAIDYFQQPDHNTAFLAKPFSLDEVLKKVREVLGSPNAAAAPATLHP